MTIIFNASHLAKQHHQLQILRDITLEIKKGQTVAIIGPSGVGKTTLLNILGTLEKPSSGTLEILGEDVLKTHTDLNLLRNRCIGFIFQSYHLLEEYLVLDNVLMPARIRHTSIPTSILQRAKDLLDGVGMSHRKHFLTKYLSGGEKQRVAIARALCNDPDIILADEPTGNLDETHASSLRHLLIDCAKRYGKALIVVTHNKELADMCDQRFLLKEGVLHSIE